MELHWRPLSIRTVFHDHTLGGCRSAHQVGNCGCSRKPLRPCAAIASSIRRRKRMRWSPIHIWALSRLLRPGRPDRSEADRKGRGPPLVSSWLYLAAVYVSHGGPPPRDTIWPEEALESHHCMDSSEAKSADCLCMHRSTLITKMWVPLSWTFWATTSWMSPLRL